MIILKKLLSFIVIITLFLTSFSEGFFCFAQEDMDNTAIESFAREFSQMIRENSVDNAVIDSFNANVFYSNFVPNSFLYEDMADDAFQTCRLVVKSKEKIETYGATDHISGYNDLHILQYDSEYRTKIAYESFLKCDYIEYVEPDIVAKATVDDIPGDDISDKDAGEYDDATAAAIEWLSDKIGFSNIKDKLAERIQDDYVLVGVIDSGMDSDHELLADRYVESNVNLSTTGEANSAEDDYGHGTHVSGIIANYTLNNVKIKPYKVLNRDGNGSLATIALAVDMAVADGVDIINISISGNGESQMLTDAIDNAVANDINVVVAAGNKSADLDNTYISPACIESAITVSATDRFDNLASFSNYDGPIDIAAPGVDIKSSYLNNTYLSLKGTSMAAPQVAAGLAIIETIYLDELAKKCEEIIKEYAITKLEPENENHFGAGILYLKYLLDGQPTVSDPVFSIDSCEFKDAFTVELNCPDEDADIYYIVYDTALDTINWFDSFKYSTPIKITVDTKISAIAMSDGKKSSSIVTVEYDRIADSEEDFYDINSAGYITGYYGSEKDIIVPNVINKKVVKGIAIGCFEDNNKIQNVVLPDSCTALNPSSFRNCTSLISVSGNGVTSVYSNVFEDSSIESVNFPNLTTIGAYAFSGCSKLKSIDFTFIESLGTFSFEKSGIISVNAPILKSIESNAFADCYNLSSFSAPILEVLSIGVFKNCISLKMIDTPALIDIGANAFRNTALERFYGKAVTKVSNYAFADNDYLEKVHLPAVTSTGTNVFLNCKNLKIVGLHALEELNANTFANCLSLVNLYLPKATSVGKNAFKDSSIELLRFEKIETIKSLPDTLQALVLSSTIKSITATTPNTNFIVYGYDDTYAEQYALNNNKEFKAVPSVYYESTDVVDYEEKYIMIYAIGFNCSYQWYKNDTPSNVGGTPIEGVIHFFYEPKPEDDCEAYYCVITSDDGAYRSDIVSDPILNAPEYRSADYTEYNKLLDQIKGLDRVLYDKDHLEKLDKLLEVDISGLKYSDQDQVDSHVNKLNMALDLVINSFILGDLNNDHTVSAVDARIVLKYIVGMQTLTDLQLASADMDNDGEISSLDARIILQKAVEV